MICKIRWYHVLAVSAFIFVCVGCSIAETSSSLEKLESENLLLQEKIAELESKIVAMENAPENIYKSAIEEKKNKNYESALSLLNDIKEKFPNADIIANVEKEITNIENEIEVEEIRAKERFSDLVAEVNNSSNYDESIDLLNVYISSDSPPDLISEAEILLTKVKELKNKPPLEILEAKVTFNSISKPEARLIIKNVSEKTIDAFEVAILTFDNFNRPVNHYLEDSNVFPAIGQSIIKSGQTIGENNYWDLFGHDNTTKIKAVIRSVHFTDDSIWENEEWREQVIKEKNSFD